MATYSFGGRDFADLTDLQKSWDEAAYMAANPDVNTGFTGDASWANTWGDRGLTHFLRYGAAEGRNPFFLAQPATAASASAAAPSRDTLMAQQYDQGLLSVLGRSGGDTQLSPNAASTSTARWMMGAGQNAFTNGTGGAPPQLSLLDAVNNYYTNAQRSKAGGMTFSEDTATPSYTLGSLRQALPVGNGDPVQQNYWAGNEFVMPDVTAPEWQVVEGIKWVAPETPNASNDPRTANQAAAGTVASATSGIIPGAISNSVSSAISNGIANGSMTAPQNSGFTWGEIGDAGGTGAGLLTGLMGLGTVGKGIGTLADLLGANSQMSAQGLQGLGLGDFASAMLPFDMGTPIASAMANSVYDQGFAGSYGAGGLLSASPIGANGASPLPANGFVAATSPNIGTPNPTITIMSPNYTPSSSMAGATSSAISSALGGGYSGLLNGAIGGMTAAIPTASMGVQVAAPTSFSAPPSGGGMWSHPALKTDKRPAEDVLPKLDALVVERWRYKAGVADGGEHVGPYADQWAELFGGDGESISIQDALGVALKAIKELSSQLSELRQQLHPHPIENDQAEVKLWGVQPDQLDAAWPMVSGLIAAACERGGTDTPESVLACLRSDEMQLWVAWDDSGARAIAVTKVFQMPLAKVLRIPICTGDGMADWVSLLEIIEAWAKSVGCDRIAPLARPGWERVLKEMGFRKTHVLLEKQI